MSTSVQGDVDFIEELRLRRWARENYVPRLLREKKWHPIIHDEMEKRDREVVEPDLAITIGSPKN